MSRSNGQYWADFSGMREDEDVTEYLSSNSVSKKFDRGNLLVEQDECSKSVYLITGGRFEARYVTQDGAEIWLSDIAPGEIVGEVSALSTEIRTSNVVAVQPSEAISISKANFRNAMRRSGDFALKISELLAQRVANTNSRLTAHVGMSVVSRLHLQLVEMADQEDPGSGLRISKTPNVSKLSDKIHATRESTSRALSELERRGLVERSDGVLRILNRAMIR